MSCGSPPIRDKIKSLPALERIVQAAKARGCCVVFTNGCFDLLHAGHVTLLEQAKQRGDLLVVAINSDRSVRRLKGPARPIVGQRDRALVLAALASVDYVTIFNEPTPYELISALTPDVLVKGADWKPGKIVGQDVVERHGGRVVRVTLVAGLSTTALIKRIGQSACGCG